MVMLVGLSIFFSIPIKSMIFLSVAKTLRNSGTMSKQNQFQLTCMYKWTRKVKKMIYLFISCWCYIVGVWWIVTCLLWRKWLVIFLSWWQKGWRFSRRMCSASFWWINKATLFLGWITTLHALNLLWMVRTWLDLENTQTHKSSLCLGLTTLQAFRFISEMEVGFQSHLIITPSSSMLEILFRYNTKHAIGACQKAKREKKNPIFLMTFLFLRISGKNNTKLCALKFWLTCYLLNFHLIFKLPPISKTPWRKT